MFDLSNGMQGQEQLQTLCSIINEFLRSLASTGEIYCSGVAVRCKGPLPILWKMGISPIPFILKGVISKVLGRWYDRVDQDQQRKIMRPNSVLVKAENRKLNAEAQFDKVARDMRERARQEREARVKKGIFIGDMGGIAVVISDPMKRLPFAIKMNTYEQRIHLYPWVSALKRSIEAATFEYEIYRNHITSIKRFSRFEVVNIDFKRSAMRDDVPFIQLTIWDRKYSKYIELNLFGHASKYDIAQTHVQFKQAPALLIHTIAKAIEAKTDAILQKLRRQPKQLITIQNVEAFVEYYEVDEELDIESLIAEIDMPQTDMTPILDYLLQSREYSLFDITLFILHTAGIGVPATQIPAFTLSQRQRETLEELTSLYFSGTLCLNDIAKMINSSPFTETIPLEQLCGHIQRAFI
jgi:hypothetical protein